MLLQVWPALLDLLPPYFLGLRIWKCTHSDGSFHTNSSLSMLVLHCCNIPFLSLTILKDDHLVSVWNSFWIMTIWHPFGKITIGIYLEKWQLRVHLDRWPFGIHLERFWIHFKRWSCGIYLEWWPFRIHLKCLWKGDYFESIREIKPFVIHCKGDHLKSIWNDNHMNPLGKMIRIYSPIYDVWGNAHIVIFYTCVNWSAVALACWCWFAQLWSLPTSFWPNCCILEICSVIHKQNVISVIRKFEKRGIIKNIS